MTARVDARSFAAAQDFILGAKSWWTQELYPALQQDYEQRAAKLEAAPATTGEVDDLIGETLLYRYYAWLERHLQRYKYSARYGLQPFHEQDHEALEGGLASEDLP